MSSMSETHAGPPQEVRDGDTWSGSEEERLSGYRSVSLLAVVALLLGLLSPVALVNAVLWAVPILGLIVAAAAYRAIVRAPDRMTGRGMALVAIGLCTLFLSLATAHSFSRTLWLRHEGRQFMDLWLELIRRQELQKAHQLHLPKPQRAGGNIPLANYYQNDERARQRLEAFVQQQPQQTLLAHAESLRFEHLRHNSSLQTRDGDYVQHIYRASFEDAGRRRWIDIAVSAVRKTSGLAGRGAWRITDIRREEDLEE